MKTKLVIVAVLILVGLWAANRYLNPPRSSAISLSSQSDAGAAERDARQRFVVGFLPVT